MHHNIYNIYMCMLRKWCALHAWPRPVEASRASCAPATSKSICKPPDHTAKRSLCWLVRPPCALMPVFERARARVRARRWQRQMKEQCAPCDAMRCHAMPCGRTSGSLAPDDFRSSSRFSLCVCAAQTSRENGKARLAQRTRKYYRRAGGRKDRKEVRRQGSCRTSRCSRSSASFSCRSIALEAARDCVRACPAFPVEGAARRQCPAATCSRRGDDTEGRFGHRRGQLHSPLPRALGTTSAEAYGRGVASRARRSRFSMIDRRLDVMAAGRCSCRRGPVPQSARTHARASGETGRVLVRGKEAHDDEARRSAQLQDLLALHRKCERALPRDRQDPCKSHVADQRRVPASVIRALRGTKTVLIGTKQY